jgi:hypothetical protein
MHGSKDGPNEWLKSVSPAKNDLNTIIVAFIDHRTAHRIRSKKTGAALHALADVVHFLCWMSNE